MFFSNIDLRRLMLPTLFLLMCAFPFFFMGGPSAYSTPLFHTLWDCGHIVFFAGLVLLLQTKMNVSGWRPCVVISLIVFVLGGAIEIIQAHTGRYGNWQDVLHDLLGAWLGLFWLQKRSYWVLIGRILVVVLLAFPFSKIFFAAWSQLHAKNNFPQLANFESAIDQHGWKGDIARTQLQHSLGNYSLKVHLSTKKYSGVSFTEFYHSWQGYTSLSFDLYNPEPQAVDLAIRICDVLHELSANDYSDRFNQKLHLENGWNHFDIQVEDIRKAPAARRLELNSISSIIIFAMQLQQAQDIYIDNMALK